MSPGSTAWASGCCPGTWPPGSPAPLLSSSLFPAGSDNSSGFPRPDTARWKGSGRSAFRSLPPDRYTEFPASDGSYPPAFLPTLSSIGPHRPFCSRSGAGRGCTRTARSTRRLPACPSAI